MCTRSSIVLLLTSIEQDTTWYLISVFHLMISNFLYKHYFYHDNCTIGTTVVYMSFLLTLLWNWQEGDIHTLPQSSLCNAVACKLLWKHNSFADLQETSFLLWLTFGSKHKPKKYRAGTVLDHHCIQKHRVKFFYLKKNTLGPFVKLSI